MSQKIDHIDTLALTGDTDPAEIAACFGELAQRAYPDDWNARKIFVTRRELYEEMVESGRLDAYDHPAKFMVQWVRYHLADPALQHVREHRLSKARGYLIVGTEPGL
jgi:hypothetical protein